MAKKSMIVMFDIEFPDSMTDPENVDPLLGERLSAAESELLKIIRDGATEDSFDLTVIHRSDHHREDLDIIFDLVAQ